MFTVYIYKPIINLVSLSSYVQSRFINYKATLLLALLLMCCGLARSQSKAMVDSLTEHIRLYGFKKQGATLFVHFDKTLYTNNENVWFTGYILKGQDKNRYKTLALMLIGDNDRNIILQEKFVIKNGYAFGNTFIPDSARTGNYTFIAYTNSMIDGRIEVLFTQPITVKSSFKAQDVPTGVAHTTTAGNILQTNNIRFYPESGSLVNNVENVIGWEAINTAGIGFAKTAHLYKDDELVNTVETDITGQGKFALKPQVGHKYALKDDAGRIYKLPDINPQGAVIALQQAFAKDSLKVEVANATGLDLTLLCHNYRQTFLVKPVAASAGKNTIAINLSGIPKGLTQLTLVDSMGRPYAERSFFAHYGDKVELNINTDKQAYTQREKVNVKIRLLNPADSAKVSVAVVDEGRIETGKQRKINNYIYLQQQLESATPKPDYLANNTDPKQLETMLLIKGWKRYTWADALRTRAADTVQLYDEITFKGRVYRYDNTVIKNPVSIVKSNYRIVTDANGNFSVNDLALVSLPGKKVNFVVDDRRPNNYRVFLLDAYLEINEKLKQRFNPLPYTSATRADQVSVMTNLGEVLADVNIRTRKAKPVTANICGDYVCRYEVLNCVNHRSEPDNIPAVKGHTYYINSREQIYEGCGGISEGGLNAIYEAAEFYPADYDKKNPETPEYVSTLFWKHQLNIAANKDATFSFFTGDITGKFKIIVQGTGSNDVIYGETDFTVIAGEKKVQ